MRRQNVGRVRQDIVITPGEILRDEQVETDIDLQDRDADTKVRTAVAWLERAGFLQRNENVTSVFQARLLVHDLAEAETRLASLNLSRAEQETDPARRERYRVAEWEVPVAEVVCEDTPPGRGNLPGPAEEDS